MQPLPRLEGGAAALAVASTGRVLLFGDVEASINDGELYEEKDELLDRELTTADRRLKKEIRYLEAEVSKWQFLVDKVST